MQAQAYEGYIEGGQFYPRELPIRLAGRFRAILTVLDVPAQADTSAEWEININTSRRMEWLKRLETAVALSADDDLPDWPFERSKEMHPPLDLAD
jgi:hypothetical protein